MRYTIRSWSRLQRLFQTHHSNWRRWAFRGQTELTLAPALEVALKRFQQPYSAERVEENLLREFSRHFHRITHGLPEPRNRLEWLALMRHHGAPTRLLDWSYSFWLAVYFAVARRSRGDSTIVHGVDYRTLNRYGLRRLDPWLREEYQALPQPDKDPELLDAVLDGQAPSVLAVNPLRLNSRLAGQQGLFLAPTTLSEPFEACLDAIRLPQRASLVLELRLQDSFLEEALVGLRAMGITQVALFPDLDGLARGLEDTIGIPHIYEMVGDPDAT